MKKLCILITSVILLLAAAACSVQTFSGSVTGNDDQFALNFSMLNTNKSHEINLKEDATINVDISKESGRLDILVTDAAGETVYKGDDASSGSFSFEIPKTDTYKFTVTGKKAKGSVSFLVAQ
jgi:hypothetical protein